MVVISGIFITLFMILLTVPFLNLIEIDPNTSTQSLTQFFIYFFSAFIIYCIAVYFVRERKKSSDTKKELIVLIVFLILVRLPFLIADSRPALSTDIYRYWWDGKVQAEGYNPYHYSPKDFPDSKLKQGLYLNINHKEYPTIYGPFSQFVFYLSYSMGLDLLGFKLSILIFDLLIMLLLFFWLKRKKLNYKNIIIYGFNPLVLIEFYNGGHSDVFVAFFITLSLYLFEKKEKLGSLISLAFLTLTKYIGIAFLPLYYKQVKWHHFIYYFGIIACFYLIYYNPNMFTSLKSYSQFWKFNASFYYLFYFPLKLEGFIVKLILIIPFSIFYLMQWRKILKDSHYFVPGFLFILSLILIISPVVYPWYLTMILPVMAIYFYRPWILFSGLVMLSYFVLFDYFKYNLWKEELSILLVQYIPFYGLIIYDYITKKK